jgi:hypothetical protein
MRKRSISIFVIAGILVALFLCTKENPLHSDANIDAKTSASSVVGSPGDPIAIAKGNGNYLYAFMLRDGYEVCGKKQTQLGPKNNLYSLSWPTVYQRDIGTNSPSFLAAPNAFTAGMNSTGKMFVFAVNATNSHVWWTNENTAGSISSFIAWAEVNSYASAGRIKCNTYPDGTIALFGINSTDNKIFVSRRYNGAWQTTYPIGNQAVSSGFDVVKRSDGRLALIIAASNQIYSITQSGTGPNYTWPSSYSPVGGAIAVYPGTDMHAILNGRDSVQIFAADEGSFCMKTSKLGRTSSGGEQWDSWVQIASYIPQNFELVRDNSSPKKIIIMYDSMGVDGNYRMAALKEQSNSRSPYVKFTTDPYPNELVGPAIDNYRISFAGFNYSNNGTAAFFVNFHHPLTNPDISFYDIYNLYGSASGWNPNEWDRLGYPSEPPILP